MVTTLKQKRKSANEYYVRRVLREQVGFTEYDVDRMWNSPVERRVFQLSVRNNIEPVVSYLKSLDITASALVSILTEEPLILSKPVDDHIIPIVTWLFNVVGNQAPAVLLRCPKLMLQVTPDQLIVYKMPCSHEKISCDVSSGSIPGNLESCVECLVSSSRNVSPRFSVPCTLSSVVGRNDSVSTQRRVNPDRPMEIMLVDLDDCLYQQPGMAQQVSRNIQKYMVEYLGFSEDTVQEESRALYLEHGTTLSGLVNALGKTIDYDHWHSHVHWSLDYETYIRPDPTLRKMLDGIPVKKFIFTNADKRHAAICLDLLGLTDCFSGVICFETMLELVGKYPDRVAKHDISPEGGVLCKPHPLAWEMALAHVDGEASVTMFLMILLGILLRRMHMVYTACW
eukprot:jgi/Picre1/28459/NNA_003863.t1